MPATETSGDVGVGKPVNEATILPRFGSSSAFAQSRKRDKYKGKASMQLSLQTKARTNQVWVKGWAPDSLPVSRWPS
jgi:hypothetical protein